MEKTEGVLLSPSQSAILIARSPSSRNTRAAPILQHFRRRFRGSLLPMTHEPGGGGVIPTTDAPERSFLENDRDSQCGDIGPLQPQGTLLARIEHG